MKRRICKLTSAVLSAVLSLAMLLQISAVALAFDLDDDKWSFMQLAVTNTGEVLSESHSLNMTDELNRAYNPYTERAALSFAVEKTQPYAIEVYTRAGSGDIYGNGDPRGAFVGYLKGKYDGGETTVFNDTTAQYFKGYDGLLQALIDASVTDPYPGVSETDFINTIEWDGEVVGDGGGFVTLTDNTEYIIALQPLTPALTPAPPDEPEPEPESTLPPPDAYLAVKLDRTLPPVSLGTPIGAYAPFDALMTLPGQHNINTITGNYIYSNVDIAVSGAQVLAFTRTYNSTGDYTGILGANWRTNYDYSLVLSELSARIYMPDGAKYDFTENYDGTYTAPESSDMTLVKSGGTFTLTTRDKTIYEFDSNGKITKITTLGGFVTTFTNGTYGPEKITSSNRMGTGALTLELTYDGSGRIVTATDPASTRSVTYEYDGNGNLTKYTDPQGLASTYTYNGDHKLTSFTDGNNRECITLTYDAYGRVTAANIGGAAQSCTLAYDLAARTTTATDATSRSYTYAYDRDRNVTSITKPTGTQSYIYENGRVISETSPEGKTTSYAYDTSGNMTSTTRPDGSGSRIEYNGNNLPVKVETLDILGIVVSSASYEYDTYGNITKQTDKAGNETTYTYDENNNCVTSTTSGKTTTYTYTGGRLTGVETPDGGGFTRVYNAQGKVTSETTKLGYETTYEYDANGYLVKTIDPLNNITLYEVDANGRTTAEIVLLNPGDDKANGIRTEWTCDTMGNVTQMTDPLGRVTEYEYDSMGRLLGEVYPYTPGNPDNPEQPKTTYVYDEDGRVLSMTDARGSKWEYSYNADNLQTGLTDPYSNSYAATYDDNGNMLTSKDPLGAVTSFEYNTEGYVVKAIDPLNATREFTYDGNGSVTSATDENGKKWTYTYDARGNMISAEDPLGKITAYGYDSDGKLLSIETPLGIEQTFEYDVDGNLTKSIDGEANETLYSYDALSRLTKVTYADGTSLEYTYDALGRLTEYTDAAGNNTQYEYDAAGQLTKHTDALDNETVYTYDMRGNLASVTDALQNDTTYAYDENNNLLNVTDALGQSVAYEYDKLDRVTKTTDQNGGITKYEYDANGNVTKITTPDGGEVTYTYDLNNRLTSANDGYGAASLTYDKAGNVTAVTDPNGNATALTYDALNRNTKTALPDGGEISYAYDDDGRLRTITQKITDSDDAVTTYTYDDDNRVVGIVDALGHSRTVAYNAVGQVISETDENNNTSHYEYDANGNLTKYTDPMGNITQYTYDAIGRLISETAPRGGLSETASITTYAYDALGRVTTVTDALNRKTALTYDKLGRIETVTDAKGGVTTYGYDKNGNITSTTDALGNVSTFEYDAMNRLIKAEIPGGAITLYEFDTRGLVTRVVDPSRGEILAVYDAGGNLISETDALGNVTQYEYDAMSRVKEIAYGVDTIDAKTVTYAYNAAGQLVELDDPTGITKLESDVLGRLTQVIDPQSNVTSYTWDNAGNRASITAPDGTLTQYAYNANNQMTKAVTGTDTTSYSYYGTTQLRGITLPTGEETRYSYDILGRLVSELHSKDGTDVRSYSYKYDELGRLTSETRDNIGIGVKPTPQETYEYRYDALDRLTQQKGSNGEITDYSYDAMGNLLREVSSINGETVYTYNTKNQLTAKTSPEGVHTFAYDAVGNLTTETLDGNTVKTLEYDATGRFVSGTNGDGETTQYTYNGLGYRVGNTTTRANPNYTYRDSPNAEGSEYIGGIDDVIDAWDTSDFYTRFDASGKARQDETATEVKTYVPDFTTNGLRDIMVSTDGLYDQTLTYGLGLISITTVATPDSEPSVQQTIATQSNGKVYAHQNRLGGNSYYTDPDGELTAYFEFDAWGVSYTDQPEDANYSGLDIANGFTGYTYDAVIEVYFAQARLYDASNKRFLQTDPIGGSVTISLSLNAYLYCRDDPVNNIDPTGRYMPGDEALNLTPEQTAAIAVCSDNYFAAVAKSDTAGMQLAHDTADEIRAQAGKTQQTGTNQPPSSYANLQNAAAYYYVPTPYEIVVGAITATSKDVMSKEQILKTASEWLAYSSSLREFGSGASGTVVNQLQTRLNTLGYTDGNGRKLDVDGSFGVNTANALAKFNSERGLSSSRVDLTTWTALGLSPADYINLTEKNRTVVNNTNAVTGAITSVASSSGVIINNGTSAVDAMIKIAVGEVGYTETADNQTKYGAAFGLQDEWCVMFVWWAANQAGITLDHTASTRGMKSWYRDNAALGYANNGYTPQSGDIVFYQWYDPSYEQPNRGHTGLVIGYDEMTGYVYTVEGNVADMVSYNKFNLSEFASDSIGATVTFGINVGADSNNIIASANDTTARRKAQQPTRRP